MALKDYLGEQFLGILASYRASGIVDHIGVGYLRRNHRITIDPLKCQLMRGLKRIEELRAPGYAYPANARPRP